jgi:hypothetical protein
MEYVLEQEFMYDTIVKSGSARKGRRVFQHKYQDVVVPHKETIYGTVNK